jgi:hypothetical protein
MVTIWGVVRIVDITTAGTGTLVITGLPFGTGANMASVWPNSNAYVVNIYGSGVNTSAVNYPPPLAGTTGSPGSTSFEVGSYGKNYRIETVIGDLTVAYWIYEIYGSYTV